MTKLSYVKLCLLWWYYKSHACPYFFWWWTFFLSCGNLYVQSIKYFTVKRSKYRNISTYFAGVPRIYCLKRQWPLNPTNCPFTVVCFPGSISLEQLSPYISQIFFITDNLFGCFLSYRVVIKQNYPKSCTILCEI